MQKHQGFAEFAAITADAGIDPAQHGWRAKCLHRLVRLDLPVPRSVAIPASTVRAIAAGHMPDISRLLTLFDPDTLVSVRPSPERHEWGGPGTILNIGMNAARRRRLAELHGQAAANALHLTFVQTYAVHVARLDPDLFEADAPSADALARAQDAYHAETDEELPEDPARQLAEVLRSMARAWEGTSARLLRQAKGAPADAALGLVVQAMALGCATERSGTGTIQLACPTTGQRRVMGQFRPGALAAAAGRARPAMPVGATGAARDGAAPAAARAAGGSGAGAGPMDKAGEGAVAPAVAGADPEAPAAGGSGAGGGAGAATATAAGAALAFETVAPDAYAQLLAHGTACRARLREEMLIEFTLESGRLWVLDAVPMPRSSRAAVRIAVDLAQDGIITPDEAVLRIEPRALSELLHPQVNPGGRRDVLARGIGASPGAARGRVVFTSSAAQAAAARGEPCILVRRETTPEDIRGMHVARGVLTERGGMTSHAAVIGRGLGLPCVVGASGIRIDARSRTLAFADGRILGEGDVLTVDGTHGEVLAGEVELLEPALDDSFRQLLAWADAVRDIGIRANADTPADARLARDFDAQGIGLCRTEHMFFEDDRLTVMREMIFADTPEDRRAALDRLLPMQREDFIRLFEIMQGQPVCIRLFDPPLHEFLPHGREGLRTLADALDKPLSEITRRAEALAEYNPMLGMRGVRLGITLPEIYDMQARAIFEATAEASRNGAPVVPEIMIPLVSARREVELVKARIDAVAAAVRMERRSRFTYRLGVMVETPRAALRAGEIAQHTDFLSFGTNDLTQMTYGLSRDDAGRFMSSYVQQGVFPEDPFHMLDIDGVGELLSIGARRGRTARPGLTLSICGEHGGNSESIAFCRASGFDYVSASPFRVPVARLAAAQLALRERIAAQSHAPPKP